MSETIPKCLACESAATKFWFEKTNAHGCYPISRCRDCGSAWVYPRPTEAVIARFYEQYNRHPSDLSIDDLFARVLQQERDYPNSTIDAARFASRCRMLTRGNRFLDVGAGYGFSSRAALDVGFEVTALEPSAVSREIVKKLTNITAEPSMLTREFVAVHERAFDVVLLSQVLEHMLEVEAVIDQLATLLDPSGVLCLAVPHFASAISRLQGKGDMFISPPEHVNFFSRSGLEKLLLRRGFVIVKMETVSRVDVQKKLARLPLKPARNVADRTVRAIFSAMDAIKTGMFLNVYARRA